MSVTERLDAFQRSHPVAGFPLAVVYKFFDDQGGYLTALITYYGFLSLLPLLLLLVTILGFALEGDPVLRHRVLSSALSQFPIIGDQLRQNVHSLHGSGKALAVGIVGGLYGALGAAQAAQTAFNRVWAVPRVDRPNPIKARLRSLALLGLLGGGVLLVTVVSALTTEGEAHGFALALLVHLAGIAVNAGLFVLGYRLLTARNLSTRDVLPGAIGAAIMWQVLQSAGTYYLRNELAHANATYGLFGIVLGLLAWIYLGALTLVLFAEVNAVRKHHLWPRALLTPFTDDVELTPEDRRAYESYAETEQHKGFEDVDVDFDGGRERH